MADKFTTTADINTEEESTDNQPDVNSPLLSEQEVQGTTTYNTLLQLCYIL